MAYSRTANDGDSKPFKDLFNSPEDFNRVFDSMEHTIMASFAIDRAVFGRNPKITNEKVAARYKICEKWFRIMRGDLGWGLTRTLDTLPKALACELLDEEYDPTTMSAGWSRMDFDREVARIRR